MLIYANIIELETYLIVLEIRINDNRTRGVWDTLFLMRIEFVRELRLRISDMIGII